MTESNYLLLMQTLLYVFPVLQAIIYLRFLPRAKKEFANKRPTHGTRNLLRAFGFSVMLVVLFCWPLARSPWTLSLGFVWLMLNAFAAIIAHHLWQRNQILSNPDHPLHELYSSMIMKGKD